MPATPAPAPSLEDLRLYCAVAEARSFSAAARELGMPLATVSRRVAELERRLGLQLLQRSTRRVEPTDAGLLLAERAAAPLRDLDEAIDCLAEERGSPRGRLRVTMPPNLMHQWLAPAFAEFARRHPEMQLSLDLSSGVKDLVGERIDLAIRAGPIPDSALLARPLATLTQGLYASPAYLAGLPPIRKPADLEPANALVLSGRSIDREWQLRRGRRQHRIRPRGNVELNEMASLIALTAAGGGIAMLAVQSVREHVREGRLAPVLAGWTGPPVPIHAMYTDRRMPARLRALLDHLRAWVREQPTP